ncbi:MAG: glycine--tRNA ligase subunit beta [Armatimonadetes bacterium]|nr:glycine--tRNA ligase subunit beta [Armatimonadota bacterium]
MPADFLLEIGVEEIPATVVLRAVQQLEEGLRQALERNRLVYQAVRATGTPRRLIAFVSGLAERQADAVVEYKGPPADQAFDTSGAPTKAAEGFARARGVSVDELEVRETDRGRFVFARVVEAGRAASEVLAELIPELVASLTFPKTMRWGAGEFRFCRPIRWVVALFGEDVLPVSIAGLRAGRFSRSHRVLGNRPVEIARAADYFCTLENQLVIADHVRRQAAVVEAVTNAAGKVGGRPRLHDDLVEEVAFMVEYPSAVLGSFSERFLDLPEPVIVKVLEGHQRFFAVETEDGCLMPNFVSVRDGPAQGLENVRRGNEWVIEARLEDAEFYMHEDLKLPLPSRIELLDGIVFMAGLGTMRDKARRLAEMVGWLGSELGYDEQVLAAARRAAQLAKCDLTTMMIADTKLGELQGIVGAEYARRCGEDEAVAAAIEEHYRPRTATDDPPPTPAGRLLATADRLDNLVACYALGLRPSGSEDPYALRRQMAGLIAIAVHGNLRYPLRTAVARAYELLAQDSDVKLRPLDEVASDLHELASVRLDAALQEAGVRYDICRAVNAAGWSDFVEAWERATLLSAKSASDPEWEHVVLSGQRIANILRPALDQCAGAVNEDLLRQDEERKLLSAVRQCASQMPEISADGSWERLWQMLVDLAPLIDRFFDEVMVMDEDLAVRGNRLALLAEAERLFMALADFREIVLD